jgi:16S rRNA (guanine(966)-N(2))-methyltransferase RsmD
VSTPRIIGGTARGIHLQDVPGNITRPITDRVKENLFNIIAASVPESTWLDLFGGTGSVGIEALSRGASFVRFNDLNFSAVMTMRKNIVLTKLEKNAEVIQSDAFSLIRRKPDRFFDFIYVAPPQYKELWEQIMTELDQNPTWLKQEGEIIVQIDPVEYKALNLNHFSEFDKRKYGNTILIFYEFNPSESIN